MLYVFEITPTIGPVAPGLDDPMTFNPVAFYTDEPGADSLKEGDPVSYNSIFSAATIVAFDGVIQSIKKFDASLMKSAASVYAAYHQDNVGYMGYHTHEGFYKIAGISNLRL